MRGVRALCSIRQKTFGSPHNDKMVPNGNKTLSGSPLKPGRQ